MDDYCHVPQEPVCKNCQQAPASKYCDSCRDLCDDCSSGLHGQRALAHHVVCPIAEKYQRMCAHNKSTELFCMACERPACGTLCPNGGDHVGHRFLDIPKAAAEKKRLIQQKYHFVDSDMDKFNSRLAKIGEEQQAVEADHMSANALIDAACEQAHNKIDARAQQLKHEAALLSSAKLENLSALQEQDNASHDALTNLREGVQRLLEKDDLSLLLECKPWLSDNEVRPVVDERSFSQARLVLDLDVSSPFPALAQWGSVKEAPTEASDSIPEASDSIPEALDSISVPGSISEASDSIPEGPGSISETPDSMPVPGSISEAPDSIPVPDSSPEAPDSIPQASDSIPVPDSIPEVPDSRHESARKSGPESFNDPIEGVKDQELQRKSVGSVQISDEIEDPEAVFLPVRNTACSNGRVSWDAMNDALKYEVQMGWSQSEDVKDAKFETMWKGKETSWVFSAWKVTGNPHVRVRAFYKDVGFEGVWGPFSAPLSLQSQVGSAKKTANVSLTPGPAGLNRVARHKGPSAEWGSVRNAVVWSAPPSSSSSNVASFQVTVDHTAKDVVIGVCSELPSKGSCLGDKFVGGIGYHSKGSVMEEGRVVSGDLASYGPKDVIRVQLDYSAKTLSFFKNGVLAGKPIDKIDLSQPLYAAVSMRQRGDQVSLL